ncbi:hypothetical protein ACIFOC_00500 [Leucobacter aridicollis]|nr:hypothetical protein [Leucobacter aridicollis]MBL3682679.1 hypothetical protein [Leucobacter aridicollis]RKQ89134.1 hypothetical protein U746_1462 [Mycolicibacterium mucogenicum 261Sha1.1M5]
MDTMLSDSFRRLPSYVQQGVLDYLDEEIRIGFQKSEDAAADEKTTPEGARQLADGIVRSLALRNSFTGESVSSPRDLGIGKRQ